MPRFSIIIPVYNVGEYITQCLNSICAQTYPNFEAIVIDDGSLDNSPAICDEFAKKDVRIKVFHKENGGVSTALNLGLECAKGDWLYFVDGDDWIENNLLEKVNEGLTNHPNVDILGFGYVQESSSGYIKSPIHPADVEMGRDELDKMMAANLFPKWIERKYAYSLPEIRGRWDKVFKKELVEQNKIRFNVELTTGQDAFFVLECLECSKRFVLIDEFLYHYRVVENSAIHKFRKNFEHLKLRYELSKNKEIYNKSEDYRQCLSILLWVNVKTIFLQNLFHKQSTLNFSQKRLALKNFLSDYNDVDILISQSLILKMPIYAFVLFMIRHRLLTPLLLLGYTL